MKTTKYFLYARKSSEDDEHQLLSIDAQINEVREYAKKESLNVVREFVESRTAKKPGRPVFDAMLREVEEGDVCGLLAWHPDRLARNSVDGGRVIYLLDTGKLTSLKFPTFWFDNTPQGKFMLNISFGQSKYYIDNLSENVKRGIREKLRRGEYPGKPPVGYLNEPRLRTIIVDKERAEYVVRLFETCAKGRYGFTQLVEFSELWGLTSIHGKPLSKYSLRKLLVNPFYVGVFIWCGETYKGAHEPLIDWKLFDRVQAVLRRKSKGTYKHSNYFPFSGMMTCGECGCSITAEKQKGRTYYRCTRKGAIDCKGRFIREEVLAYLLGKQMERVAIPVEWADKMLAEIHDICTREVGIVSMKLMRAQEQLDSVQAKLDRLLEAYLENAITKPEYLEYKARWIPERSKLMERSKALQAYRNPTLEQLEELITVAREANVTAARGTREDLRDFYCGMSADLVLGPESVTLPKTQVLFRNEELTLWQRVIPCLKVTYPPAWRVLDERSDDATWQELLEGLKAALGVNEELCCLEDGEVAYHLHGTK